MNSCLKLAVLGVVVLVVFVCETSMDCIAQDSDWQQRLPVSMNGKLPEDFPDGFETKHWNSLRLSRFFRGQKKEASFDLGTLKQRKLFPTDSGEKLKKAILESDVAQVKDLIKQGVDVNEQGKEGVTPLHLAMYVDTDPRPFELLINNDADPNVPCWTDCPPLLGQGSTVSLLASVPAYNRLFELTFQTSGDPNGKDYAIYTPNFAYAIGSGKPDALERLAFLVKKGIEFDREDAAGRAFVPALLLGSRWAPESADRRYEIALAAMKLGADYQKNTYSPRRYYRFKDSVFAGCHFKPIHFLALSAMENDRVYSTSAAAKSLVRFLEENGQSLEQAVGDLKRWKKWKLEGRDDLIEKEYQQRVGKEKRKNEPFATPANQTK